MTADLTPALFNLFKETRLRTHSVQSQVGEGTLDLGPKRYVLTITPRAGRSGSVAVTYKVVDATEDPSRYVQGKIISTVRDRLVPPTVVKASIVGAGRARVSFTPGANNGAQIDYYEMTDMTTGQNYRCATALREVSGLRDGEEHAFTVCVHNEVGYSDLSVVSNYELIDAVPGKVFTSTIKAEDRELVVSWVPPYNEGSAITRYTLSIAGVDGIRTQEVISTSATVRSLRNGQSYTLSVVAHNRAKEPSQSSDGAIGTLYGFPDIPSSVTTTVIEASADGQGVTVQMSWNRGSPEDSDQGNTTVSVGGISTSVDKNQVSAVIGGAVSEISHEVRVQISNIHGNTSNVGIPSMGVSTIPLASATDNLRLESTGVGGELKVRGSSERGGCGYDSSDLQIHYAAAGQACNADSEFLDMTKMTVSSYGDDPVSYSFCQVSAAPTGHSSVSEIVTTQAVAPESKPETPALTAPLVSASSITAKWNIETASPLVTSAALIVDDSRVPVEYKNGTYALSELEADKAHVFVLEISDAWGTSSSAPLTVAAQGAGG